MSKRAAPVLDYFGRSAVAFLNKYLEPWTFVGDEPIAVALAQLIREESAEDKAPAATAAQIMRSLRKV